MRTNSRNEFGIVKSASASVYSPQLKITLSSSTLSNPRIAGCQMFPGDAQLLGDWLSPMFDILKPSSASAAPAIT